MKSLECEALASLLLEIQQMEACNEVKTIYFSLPGNIGGFTYRSVKGTYYIVINENLSAEMQVKVAYHEAKHVLDSEMFGIYVCDLEHNECNIYEIGADDFADKALLQLASNFL